MCRRRAVRSQGLAGYIVAWPLTEGRGRADDDSLKAVAPLWYGFALAGLIGIFTIIGFELAANLSEEAVNARLTVPKAVIYSVITAMTFGFIALVGFTMALPDVKSPDPIGTVAFWVGTFWTKVFLELVITSIFALTVVVTGGAARLVTRWPGTTCCCLRTGGIALARAAGVLSISSWVGLACAGHSLLGLVCSAAER